MVSCTKNIKPDEISSARNIVPQTPPQVLGLNGLRLTTEGDNSRSRISTAGQTILFLSKNRRSHRHTQVYEISLSDFHERRVTYNDGETTDAEYSPDGEQILYASTTDELKERPQKISPQLDQHGLPQELYLSDRFGNEIQRLTNSVGSQNSPSWISKTSFLFASSETKQSLVYKFELGSNQQSPWGPINREKINLMLPTIDNTATRVAWVEKNETEELSIGVKIKGVLNLIKMPFVEINSLSWVPSTKGADLLLISAKKNKTDNLAIWAFNTKSNCLNSYWQESQGDLLDIAMSTTEDKMVMSYRSGGSSQIYLLKPLSFTENCDLQLSAQKIQALVIKAPKILEPKSPAADQEADQKKQSDYEASEPTMKTDHSPSQTVPSQSNQPSPSQPQAN